MGQLLALMLRLFLPDQCRFGSVGRFRRGQSPFHRIFEGDRFIERLMLFRVLAADRRDQLPFHAQKSEPVKGNVLLQLIGPDRFEKADVRLLQKIFPFHTRRLKAAAQPFSRKTVPCDQCPQRRFVPFLRGRPQHRIRLGIKERICLFCHLHRPNHAKSQFSLVYTDGGQKSR